MAHLELHPKRRVSSFRKLAIGSWSGPYDPTVYGTVTVRMDRALAWLESYHQRTGVRLTVTHLVLKAVAEALRRCPDVNAVLRFHRIYLRQRVTVTALVARPGAAEGPSRLVPVRIEDAERRSLSEIAAVLDAAPEHEAALALGLSGMARIPGPLRRLFMRCASFLAVTLNLDPGRLGLPKDAFGSVLVVEAGALGLDTAYLPLLPFTRVPVCVAPGALRRTAVVEEGRVVVGTVMNINASIDHRFVDGFHAGVLANTMRELLEDPASAFG